MNFTKNFQFMFIKHSEKEKFPKLPNTIENSCITKKTLYKPHTIQQSNLIFTQQNLTHSRKIAKLRASATEVSRLPN